MARPASPDSLTGIALDLIAQVRGGMPSTDDEPLEVVQVIQWLRRAAAGLLLEKVRQSEADDVPLDDEWYVEAELPLTFSPAPFGDFRLRYYEARLATPPLARLGLPLMTDITVGDVGSPVQLCNQRENLKHVALGWGRVPLPKAAARLLGAGMTVVLPEFLWGVETLNLRYAPTNPLAGVKDTDSLPLSGGWQEAIVSRVLKGPLSVIVNGVPDLVNDASPTPAVASQPNS